MKFFLDENFPRAAIAVIQRQGHEAMDARDLLAPGLPDEHLFGEAQGRGAVFLTTDRDFFHTIPWLYARHFGIVVIALRQPNRERILARLEWFLRTMDLHKLAGRVYQLRDTTYLLRQE